MTSHNLEPIPTPHPLIALGSFAVIGVMLYWAFSTNLRQPSIFVSTAVVLFIVIINVASRRNRSRRRPSPLDINSR